MTDPLNLDSKPQEHIAWTNATKGERLDKLVTARLGERFSRSQLQSFIEGGHVTVNGETARSSLRLKGGEQILVAPPPPPPADSIQAEAIDLDVLYEDADIAVIHKPAGLVVHPGTGNWGGTLANAILSRWPQVAEMNYSPERRGIVHRLDKDTSGVMVLALKSGSLRRLMMQFQKRSVEKEYLALVEKDPPTPIGRIDVPILRDPKRRQRMMAARDGRPAVSEYEVIERFETGRALVRIKLLTGRTHQIRVHMLFIGAPVVGDTLYGYRKQRDNLRGQWLHAQKLCFDHPRTGERMCFEAPLPERLQTVLDAQRRR